MIWLILSVWFVVNKCWHIMYSCAKFQGQIGDLILRRICPSIRPNANGPHASNITLHLRLTSCRLWCRKMPHIGRMRCKDGVPRVLKEAYLESETIVWHGLRRVQINGDMKLYCLWDWEQIQTLLRAQAHLSGHH